MGLKAENKQSVPSIVHYISIYSVVALVMVGVALNGCDKQVEDLGLPPDSPLEQFGEKVIKNYTGFEIDITPKTPEKSCLQIDLESQLYD